MRFGALRALSDVTFALERGTLTALVGPNGSGKTTLLRVAAGLERPDAGAVRVDGLEAEDDPVAYRRRLGWLGQADGLYDELSVRENLALVARLHGSLERLPRAVDAFDVPKLDEAVRRLSRGERQRAALARATLGGPLLLLDEPTTALDAEGSARAIAALFGLRGERTILVATHDEEIVKRADRVLRLDRGSIAEGAA